MTKTPISDFIDSYIEKKTVRMHMPGHKGAGTPLCSSDITEISGADDLFSPEGIILESERIASDIFGAYTLYSTEGSSLSIRTMLHLVTLYAKSRGTRPLIAAARNAHKAFVSAAALIDFEVDWIFSKKSTYLSSRITEQDVEEYLNSKKEAPVALYLTSPDYLGYTSNIQKIAKICHSRGVLLLVDNAHGAYLKFLTPSLHPIDQGADMCCDSAHKTLNALTGCAYLHISKGAPEIFRKRAKSAMMLFASTSPSYLLLRSLDLLNAEIGGTYTEKLAIFLGKLASLKKDLISHGYSLVGDEPMKITIDAKKYGCTGDFLAARLRERGVECEFSDPDYLVLMPTPKNSDEDLNTLKTALISLPRNTKISSTPPFPALPISAVSIREASFSDEEEIPTDKSLGRVLSTLTVSCPPAIPIAVPGEIIDENVVAALDYYGITSVKVIKIKE